jgi:chromosome partitioning protein
VGKTTTTINLATALAAIGWKVLLIDLDPQGNASTGLGVAQSQRERSSYDVLIGNSDLVESAVATRVPRLDLLPATVDLSGAEIELVALEDRAHRLRKALAAAPASRWDICLIDCPPSLGLLTVNALVAAGQLLVPLQCEFFALEGLSQLLQTVERIRVAFNPSLAILGVALTMFDRRNNLSQQVADDVRACLGPAVFDTVIPRNVRLSEAPSHGLPALIYDLRCPGSEAYIRLARELMARLPQRAEAA